MKMKLIRRMILTLIMAGIIEQARSTCPTSSIGAETRSITDKKSTAITTTTTPINDLSLSRVLVPIDYVHLNAMLPSYTKSVLLYQATRDGFEAFEFHSRCDNIANTVTIISNNLNYVFGGFTAAKWSSDNVYISDPTAFIFSLRRNGDVANDKLMIRDDKKAIYGNSQSGPTFGQGHDIFINVYSGLFTGSYSDIRSYIKPSGSDQRTFLTGQDWLATEIEVYQLL